MARCCEIHTDVLRVVRPSNSVNGGDIDWGCAICNMERFAQEVAGNDGRLLRFAAFVGATDQVAAFNAKDRAAVAANGDAP
jgi:hypothetical protein